VCCSVLQCVAVCCSMLQCVAVCSIYCGADDSSAKWQLLKHTGKHCKAVQQTATHCNIHCNTLQHPCNTLQHPCNTLQHSKARWGLMRKVAAPILCCIVLLCVAVCCSLLHCVAVCSIWSGADDWSAECRLLLIYKGNKCICNLQGKKYHTFEFTIIIHLLFWLFLINRWRLIC